MNPYEEAKMKTTFKPIRNTGAVLGSQDMNCLGYTTFNTPQSDSLIPCFIAKKSMQVTKYYLSIESNQKIRILTANENLDSEKTTISLTKTHARQLPKILKTEIAASQKDKNAKQVR